MFCPSTNETESKLFLEQHTVQRILASYFEQLDIILTREFVHNK